MPKYGHRGSPGLLEDEPTIRAIQADVYERLGFGSENGTWRNAFLSGSQKLRHGTFGTPTSSGAPDMVGPFLLPVVELSLSPVSHC